MVKKAVDAEAKSALRPRSSTKEMDQNCPRGNQPANSTVAKSQSSAMKNLRSEEPKVQRTESSGSSGLSLLRKLGKRRRRNSAEGTKNVEKTPPWLQTIKPSFTKRRKRSIARIKHPGTRARSSALTIPNWTIMQIPVQSQKTSFGLGDLLVGDWD